MNIFILDNDIEKSVIYHPDKHIVKMPVEGAQLLCGVLHKTGQSDTPNIYNLSHSNHPCALWAYESLDNWIWLQRYVSLMGEEYTYRYGKKHKSVIIAEELPLPYIQSKGLTPFAKCVPIEFKNLDVVEAYRNYFIKDKQHLRKYTKRDVPEWWIESKSESDWFDDYLNSI